MAVPKTALKCATCVLALSDFPSSVPHQSVLYGSTSSAPFQRHVRRLCSPPPPSAPWSARAPSPSHSPSASRSDLRVWCGPGVTFAGSFFAGAAWPFAARRAARSTKPRARAPACSSPYLVVGSPWRCPPCRLPLLLLRWRRLIPRQTKSSHRSQYQARSRSACSPASMERHPARSNASQPIRC
jgi:hypothetical protein